MNKEIVTFIFVMGLALPIYAADEAPKTKKVCVDQKDKDGRVVKDKDGKAKQSCRDVKVHQKHEGTKVPDSAKK